jgi:chitodextrinase
VATYTIGSANGVNWTYLDLSINPNTIGSPVSVNDVWNISSFGLNIAPRSSGNGNITFCIWNSGGVLIWNSASTDIAPVDNGPGIGLESISVGTVLTAGTYYFGFSRSNLSSMQWDNESTTSGISWEGDVVGGNLSRVGSGQTGRRLCGSVTYTVITAPGTPTSPSASGGNKSVSFSWTAPASNGGSAVAGYNVYRNDVYIGATASTSYSDTGLSNNTAYNYKVSAYNSYKTSSTTTNVSATTLNVPGAPTSFTASAGIGTSSLSWAAPTSNGGSAVTGYTLYRGATQIYTGTATSFSDTGLSLNTAYSYTVTATNAIGTGTAAAASTTTLGGLIRVSTNGVAWTTTVPKIWNGTAWVNGSTRVWNGTSWVYGV